MAPSNGEIRIWRCPALPLAFELFVAGSLLFGYLLFGYLLFWPGEARQHPTLLGAARLVPPALAAVLCWRASQRATSRRLRWSWRLLALSGLVWDLVRLQDGLLASFDENLFNPVIFHAGWQVHLLLVVAGVSLQIPFPASRMALLGALVDGLVITTALVALTWQLAINPVLATLADTFNPDVVVPLANWTIVGVLAGLTVWSPVNPVARCYPYVIAAMLVETAVYLLHAINAASPNPSHAMLDGLWVLVFALIFVAACRSIQDGDAVTAFRHKPRLLRALRFGRPFLPYLAVPSAGLMLYLELLDASTMQATEIDFAVSFAMIMLGLIVLRQLLTHAGLSRRSGQLSALNKTMTGLSHCLDSAEVLVTGLGLALKTTGLASGAIWLRGPDGEARLAIQHGVLGDLQGLGSATRWQGGVLEEASRLGCLPLHAPELDIFAVWRDLAGRAPIAVLLVPMLARREVVGAIALVDCTGTVPISDEMTIHLAQAVAAATGVAYKNACRYEEARDLADRDPVTALLNHRAFHQRLEQELSRAKRLDGNISIIMIDVDGFKLFNDTYGHPTGDQVLRKIAALLNTVVRSCDILARYGGDEFVVLLPDTSAAGAVSMAERMQAAIAQEPFMTAERRKVPIHLSFGIATFPEDGLHSSELVGFADTRLYRSKEQGGDTITVGQLPSEEEPAKLGFFGVLDGLVTAVDHKDRYTRRHSEDVTSYALALAQALNLSEESQRTLRIAGLLHDVGKIGVPDRILRKPGRLDEDELGAVRQHVLLGEMIIKEVPNLNEVLAAVGSHHERVDGQGYPRGLKNGAIPLLGRILAVVDAYSAMTSDRPYRAGLTPAEAEAELLRAAGNQLDASLVKLFLQVLAGKESSNAEDITDREGHGNPPLGNSGPARAA